MTMPTFQYYLDRYTLGTITQEEWEIFRILLKEERNIELLDYYMDEQLKESAALGWQYPTINKEILAGVLQEINKEQISHPTYPAYRVHFLKKNWIKYAAAILIFLGLGAYLWNLNKESAENLVNKNKIISEDIDPGGEKAVLTLSDGSKIILDKAADGNIAQQGNAQVVKLANGQIAYRLGGSTEEEVLLNTMSTPNGGQYMVMLPDDTKVWLNASSSITYPTAFIGKDRSVKISGEAFLEVAKDKQKPFIVDVDGKSIIQVLGTTFNINSYGDEGTIKTTLIEGSLRVQSVVLNPGQQAQMSETDPKQGIKVVNNPDIEQALAWKNGLFNFNGSDLRSVSRQLERWYDIKVRYEGAVPDLRFKGEMNRAVKLSTVLTWFSGLGIKTRLEGKTLVIL